MQIKPIILSGGSGTRLWPISRKTTPKQFVDIFNSGTNLFEQTLKKYSEKYDISIYFLHDEYMNLEIWRDSQHVAINNNTQIYTKDILEILLKEMK